MAGWAVSQVASLPAESCWARTRMGSVARPRCSRYPASGCRMPPVVARTRRSAAAQLAFAATTPPTASPCPPRYLVALCSTRSAPQRAGFCRMGVAKVLSTTTGRPSAAPATAATSTRSRVGFAGVSITTRQVSSRTADLAWAAARRTAVMAADARITNAALAARTGVAESTSIKRLRALRAAGIITGFTAQLNLAALGFPIQAVIKVRLSSHNRDHVLRFHATLTKIPGVLTAFHVAGEDDYLVHVATTSPEELRDLVLNHINVNREVQQTETQLVFSVLPGAGVPL